MNISEHIYSDTSLFQLSLEECSPEGPNLDTSQAFQDDMGQTRFFSSFHSRTPWDRSLTSNSYIHHGVTSTVIKDVQTPPSPRNPSASGPQLSTQLTATSALFQMDFLHPTHLLTLLLELSQTHTWSGSHWPAGASQKPSWNVPPTSWPGTKTRLTH